MRPAFVCEDGQGVKLTNWSVPATEGAEAIVRLENVNGADISGMKAAGKAHAFVQAEGDSKNIRLGKNKVRGAAEGYVKK